METEAKIFKIIRKIEQTKNVKNKLYKDLYKAEKELKDAKKGLAERLDKMGDIPVLEKIGD